MLNLENDSIPCIKGGYHSFPLVHTIYSDYLSEENRLKIATILLEAGCDIDYPNNHGETPLTIAVQLNDLKKVQFLVEHGAWINHYDRKHRTPLWHACFEGNLALVKYLVSKGANLDIRDSDGYFPLTITMKKAQDSENSFGPSEFQEILIFLFNEFDNRNQITVKPKLRDVAMMKEGQRAYRHYWSL